MAGLRSMAAVSGGEKAAAVGMPLGVAALVEGEVEYDIEGAAGGC